MSNIRIPTISQKQVQALLPTRPDDSHKGMFGTVAVIGGNNGMVGAAILAGRAALKMGAGCVHVLQLADNALAVDSNQPELMLHSSLSTLGKIAADVIAIGCGLGLDTKAQKTLHDVLKMNTPFILDADALNILSLRPDLRSVFAARQTQDIITPHPGEAARLLGITTAEVQADRQGSAHKLAARLNCLVVLKGANTLCAANDNNIWLNKTGNSGMSSPGMGDVLTGMIAGFISQHTSPENAMLIAVHLHGAAGDALAAEQARIGMTASEVTEWSRWLLNQWAKK